MNFTEVATSPNLASNETVYITASSYVYFTVHFVNFILGLPIHFYVVWLICTGKGSGIVAEFFSLNLSVCEILSCLGSALFVLTLKFPALVEVLFFFVAQPNTARPLINSVICIERYMAVLYPVSFLKYKPLRYRLPCSAVVWVMVLGLAIFCRFIILSNNIYMFFCVYLPLYSVLVFIKIFCCLAIFRALKVSGPGEKGKQREEANQIKRKAMIIILLITVTMCVQYVPIYLAGFLYESLSLEQFNLFWSIGIVISMLMAYVSPLLYIHRVRNMRLSS